MTIEQAEIPEQPQPLELANALEKVTSEIAAFDRLNAGIAELERTYPVDVVIDVSTPAGMKEAIKARAAWRDPRVAVEKARKGAKAPVLALGRQIDSFAEGLEKRLRIGEDHYGGMIRVETERVEAIKAAEKAREEARVQALRDLIALKFTSRPGRMFGQSAADLDVAIKEVVAEPVTKEVFFEFAEDAELAQGRALAALRDMHAKQVNAEAQAKEAARMAEENARQAARLAEERAEFERQQAEARKREEETRAAREAREAEERAAREADERKIREQREALAREQKAIDDAKREKADREAAEERERLDRVAAYNRERAADVQAIRGIYGDHCMTFATIAKGRETLASLQTGEDFWTENHAAALAAIQEQGEALDTREQFLKDEAKRQEKADREEAARMKAQRKLAAAQKAGPRLLEACKAAKHMLERDPIDDAKLRVIEECAAAIAEAEAS